MHSARKAAVSTIGVSTVSVTFSSHSSGKPFEVPIDEIVGVKEYEEGGSLVQNGPGMYYIVRESVIEVMRLVVAAHDQLLDQSSKDAKGRTNPGAPS